MLKNCQDKKKRNKRTLKFLIKSSTGVYSSFICECKDYNYIKNHKRSEKVSIGFFKRTLSQEQKICSFPKIKATDLKKRVKKFSKGLR